MSTKTIAVDSRIYEKLARQKREGESFTRTIDRLVDSQSGTGTCADAVRQAATVWAGKRSLSGAKKMEAVVRSNRRRANWSVEIPE